LVKQVEQRDVIHAYAEVTRNLKRSDHLKDLGLDGEIILKCI
jgi:hypothetical protein